MRTQNRGFAAKGAKAAKKEDNSTYGVYLWARMPRLGPKAGAVGTQLSMPKGNPQRIEVFDDLNIRRLFVGQRHSAVISKEGQVYTFGNGNWGVLGHGNENNIKFNNPKHVKAL